MKSLLRLFYKGSFRLWMRFPFISLLCLYIGTSAKPLQALEKSTVKSTPSQQKTPSKSSSVSHSQSFQVGLHHATPSNLETGHLLGGFLGYSKRPFSDSGFQIQVRSQFGHTSEYTLNWQVDHLEVGLLSLVGWQFHVGRVGLSMWLGGGGLWIDELRSRHQAKRLAKPSRDLNQNAQMWTGLITSELELELPLVSQLGFLMRGGPQYRWSTQPWGWSIYLGALWRFGS